ncbi:Glycosyltransferase involved in cell wall bisynthesis [Geodermatophilus amargosae]|uniref:Glycosyltransferase involved in cell wall bisynthesis n=1 Tax=Geodermatophilus amargosae TaxID=1296565 RepID=A0A1I6X7A5_9ACTN|nr:glycosyltransferase [Geodermatophilus amargosae]SFT33972.1 Glycosyltransferase involved in cell wall bisynthesis [Geodermatophilus amargosae]
MKAAISCAFNENAIWALSRYASSHGMLTQRLVPHWHLVPDAATHLVRILPGSARLARFAARKQGRVASSRLPEDETMSVLTEAIRIAGARTKTPVTPILGHLTWKVEFDRRASRALDTRSVDVLIGMPGSSKRTFGRHRTPLKVFHATDTHPRARNDALFEVYGSRARSEAYPVALTERIEEELDLADVVLVPSQVVADGMIGHGVDPAKIELIPYGVDLDRFTVGLPTAPRRTDGRPRLLFVGQICLRKGVPILMEAVDDLEVEVTLAGQVFDRSVVRGLPANVTLAGVLSPVELADAYNAHDALVLPTIDDAFALVLSEAAACGLQVVTTTAAGAAEILPRKSRVVPSGDVRALRQALSDVTVLDDAERTARATRYRAASTARAGSWDTYAQTVFTALERRLGVRTARAETA